GGSETPHTSSPTLPRFAGEGAFFSLSRKAGEGRGGGDAGLTAYLIRRVLLVIPTLFGIIAINFVVVQFAPGGPVEQMIAELRGKGDLSSRLGAATSEFGT